MDFKNIERFKKVYELRKSGMTYKQIAEHTPNFTKNKGRKYITASRAMQMVRKYQRWLDHPLNNKFKDQDNG